MQIHNLENDYRHIIARKGHFSVLEYERDLSIERFNAMEHYFMGKMGLRRRSSRRAACSGEPETSSRPAA